jgi:membrane protease YdiL (CAAX protease family)
VRQIAPLTIRKLWRSRVAFGFALTLVGASIVVDQILWIEYNHSKGFRRWSKDHNVELQAAMICFRIFVWLVASVLFSGVSSVRTVFGKWAIDRRPTVFGWIVSLIAIALGLIDVYVIHRRSPPVDHTAVTFYEAGSFLWAFYLFQSIVLAPVIQEIALRGFMYPKLRENFSVAVSVMAVLVVEVYFHWTVVAHSIPVLAILSIVWVTQCMLREDTGSLWDCIIFHFAYNSTVRGQTVIGGIGMFIALLSSALKKGQGRTTT